MRMRPAVPYNRGDDMFTREKATTSPIRRSDFSESRQTGFCQTAVPQRPPWTGHFRVDWNSETLSPYSIRGTREATASADCEG